MLTPEEIKELKQQLLDQVKHLPEDKRKQVEAQIEAMSPEALETMLNQQKHSQQPQKPILRMIIDNDIPSKKVDENKEAIAVLDIKPISKGHIIIIQKNPVRNTKDLSTQTFTLAKKISNRISSKLKAANVEIQTEEKFGEAIINVIPVYDKPLNINSPRMNESEENLEKVYDLLKVEKKEKIERIKIDTKQRSQSKVLKLPRRIP